MERKPPSTLLALALLAGCAASAPTGGPAPEPAPVPSPTAPLAAEPPPAAPADVTPAVASASSAPAPMASASAPAAPTAPAAQLGTEGKGTASFYNTDGKGSCALNPPKNRYILSASKDIYQNLQSCGACLEITGEKGTEVVQVMDLCFSCPPGNVVINKPAFEAIVGKQSGTGAVSWKTVPCAIDSKVTIRIKESSTRHWTAVQIRDSKLPLKAVAMQREGENDWVELSRSPDNYWAAAKGAGDGGFKLRITALSGQQIEESVAKGWKDGKVYPGANQF